MSEEILTVVDDARVCPFCGEIIKRVALKCRFCGEMLGDSNSPGVFRQGKRVVMSRTTALPRRCVKTNEPTEEWLDRTFSWHSPGYFLLIPMGVLIYVLVAMMVRKTHKVRIPLAPALIRRRKKQIAVIWLIALGGLAAIVGGAMTSSDNDTLGGMLILAGVLSLLAAIIGGIFVSNPVSPTRITDDYIWLKGFGREYIAELPEFMSTK